MTTLAQLLRQVATLLEQQAATISFLQAIEGRVVELERIAKLWADSMDYQHQATEQRTHMLIEIEGLREDVRRLLDAQRAVGGGS